jgi:hypothetical protein
VLRFRAAARAKDVFVWSPCHGGARAFDDDERTQLWRSLIDAGEEYFLRGSFQPAARFRDRDGRQGARAIRRRVCWTREVDEPPGVGSRGFLDEFHEANAHDEPTP